MEIMSANLAMSDITLPRTPLPVPSVQLNVLHVVLEIRVPHASMDSTSMGQHAELALCSAQNATIEDCVLTANRILHFLQRVPVKALLQIIALTRQPRSRRIPALRNILSME